MSDKRFLGNIITSTPTAPAGPFQDGAAPGVWSLQEAFTYTKAGLWPVAGNVSPIALVLAGSSSTGGGPFLSSIDQFQITTTGNASSFGNLLGQAFNFGSFASAGKAFVASRATFSSNVIETIGFSTGSTASDFGDLTVSRSEMGGYGNSTRGLFIGGGTDPGTIDYITTATAGNAIDFGDLSAVNRNQQCRAAGSDTRCLTGAFESATTAVDTVTPATTGNATNFGTLANVHNNAFVGSNLTRWICAGQYIGYSDHIEYTTVASTGSFSLFGNLSSGRGWGAAVASSTRLVFSGGSTFGAVNIMEYITIASTGNATDFGDLTVPRAGTGGAAPSTPSVTGA